MRVIDPGHEYLVAQLPFDHYELPGTTHVQSIQFVKKVGERYPGNSGQQKDGTNCQELLRVLIDRCKYLNNQIPCKETKGIVWHLRKALLLFEVRAAQIKGARLPSEWNFDYIEEFPPCNICGHIYSHSHVET